MGNQPYCSRTLETLPEEGIKTVDIICPGFAVDCLETLFEITQENKEIFQSAGGDALNYIPALNDSALHANSLLEILQDSPTSITLNIGNNQRDQMDFVTKKPANIQKS